MTIDAARRAIERGELVVYPTETVYGLGADALDPEAIEAVFALKGRDRDKPLSLAVPDIAEASDVAVLTEQERAFCHEFLPGPATVVCEKRPVVPDVLTAGRDRVGIRIPDHPLALDLLSDTAPITATSANRSGAGSVRRVGDLHQDIRDGVAVVLDDGVTPGTESTVVDVGAGEIIRRGAMADDIGAWLAAEV